MKDFAGKTAVVTGAGSGIGREIALRCAEEGMKVILADRNAKALADVRDEMKTTDAETVEADVSTLAGVKSIADAAMSKFGRVDLLFNNAGIATAKLLTDSSLEEWKRVLDVNLWSVIYGIHVFLPIMEKQDSPCHIVNTASQAGFETGTDNALYRASKHAVVSLTESLYFDMKVKKRKVAVSLLCPGFVKTNIAEGASQDGPMARRFADAVEKGANPRQIVDCLFEGIGSRQFYICPDPSFRENVTQHMQDAIQMRNPTPKLLLRLLDEKA